MLNTSSHKALNHVFRVKAKVFSIPEDKEDHQYFTFVKLKNIYIYRMMISGVCT